MKAILCDPYALEVSEVDLPDDFHELQRMIGCRYFEAISLHSVHGDRAYVDEEGALNVTDATRYVMLNGLFMHPLVGRVVIVGRPDGEGNETAPGVPVDEVRQRTEFFKPGTGHFLDVATEPSDPPA